MSSATVRQMERSARKRWNARRRKGNFEPLPETPSEWLVEHRALLGGSGRALDVACGDGRDALFLARLGYDVDAVDVSDVAIEAVRAAAAERALPIHPRVVDLEREPLPENEYDAVVCFNYLQRDLFGQLERALRPGGLLVFETFGRAHIDELGKEFNPTYVLDRNELLRAFPGLHVVHYQEGVAERSGALRGVAGIVAQRLGRSSAGRTSAGQTTKLRHEGVAFEVWDAAEPSVRLKTRPRIVLDFFGRPWVDEFCAEPLTDSDRLDAAEIARLRARLRGPAAAAASATAAAVPASGRDALVECSPAATGSSCAARDP